MVIIEVKNMGTIKLELDEKVAPVTVKNFQKLIKKGFYDGLIFHRVINGFMIQGGSDEGDLSLNHHIYHQNIVICRSCANVHQLNNKL